MSAIPIKSRQSNRTQRPSAITPLLASAAFVLGGLAAPAPAQSAVFVVNDKTDFSDQNPGDGVCDTGNFRVNLPPLSVIPECTFRAALEEANALPGPDEVRFSSLIPLIAGFAEFTPVSSYPAITDEIVINGYSHPDYDAASADVIPTPIVQFIGNSVPDETTGLDFQPGSNDSALLGVAIHQFPGSGVEVGTILSNPGPHGLSFQGNHIGAARGGGMFGNGGQGIEINSGSSMNTIGKSCNNVTGCFGRGNLISANEFAGVSLRGSNNRVAGNYIGTDSTGALDVVPFGGATGNRIAGIATGSGAMDNEIGSLGAINFGGLGGPTPVAAGNVISANGGSSIVSTAGRGIIVGAGSSGTVIKANRIGTNAEGTAVLSNERLGIELSAEATIGDTGLGGNLIAGISSGTQNSLSDLSAGIFSIGTLNGQFPGYSVTVVGNQIGVNIDGNATLGDLDVGILVLPNLRATIEDNIVGGSHTGVGAYFADVRRNFIGTNAAGDDLGNVGYGMTGSGVVFGGDLLDSNAVAASKGNVVGFNGNAGIGVYSLSGAVTVRGNRFSANNGIPFDLGPERDESPPFDPLPPDGPTPNDVGDVDIGPNELQNFPEFNTAQTSYDDVADEVTVRLQVDSLPASSTYPILVDVYARNPHIDPEDQAGMLIGSVTIEEVDAGAFTTETFTPLPGALDPDPVFGTIYAELSAVATTADGYSSEFSRQGVPVPEPGFALTLVVGAAILASRRRTSIRSSGRR